MLGTSQTRTGDGGTGHSAVQHSPAAKSAAATTAAAQATSEASATATEASATTRITVSAIATQVFVKNHRCRQIRRHVILRSADGRRRSRQIHRGHLVLWALSDLLAVAAADGANGAGTSRIPDHARRG